MRTKSSLNYSAHNLEDHVLKESVEPDIVSAFGILSLIIDTEKLIRKDNHGVIVVGGRVSGVLHLLLDFFVTGGVSARYSGVHFVSFLVGNAFLFVAISVFDYRFYLDFLRMSNLRLLRFLDIAIRDGNSKDNLCHSGMRGMEKLWFYFTGHGFQNYRT